MAENSIANLSPAALVALNVRIQLAITSAFGVPSAQVTNLNATTVALSALNIDVDSAKAAYRAAVQNRDDGRKAAAAAAAQIARTVYANPTVTSGMISDLGLSPRSSGRARIVPQAPTALNAKLLPTGEIALSWTSNNPYGVIYRVESRVGSGPWTFQTDATAKKATLVGVDAGISTAFRVSASRSGRVSAYSPVAVVWSDAAADAPALRLAA